MTPKTFKMIIKAIVCLLNCKKQSRDFAALFIIEFDIIYTPVKLSKSILKSFAMFSPIILVECKKENMCDSSII